MSSSVSAGSSDGGALPAVKRSIGTTIFGAAIVGLVILTAIGALSLAGARRLTRATHWVEHTIEVLYDLSGILGRLTDEQSGVRGFALTGQPRFLRPYDDARSHVAQDLNQMRRLVADNAPQQERLLMLERLVAERHNFEDEIIATRRARGLFAASAKIATGRGDDLMWRARGVLLEMTKEERRLLARRVEVERSAALWMLLLASSVAASGLLLVILGSVYLFRAVTNPTRRLLAGVQRLGAGDLSVHIPIEANDEFGQLSWAFNDMVSRRRSTEEALASANAFLEGLFQASPLAIIGVDTDGKVDVWNPVAECLFGYARDDVLGRALPVFPPEASPDFAAIRRRVLERHEVVLGIEGKRRRKDGSLFDALVSVAPRLQEGKARGMLAIAADVTTRNRKLEELRESEERFRLTFEEAPIGMALVGLDGRLLRVNNVLCEIVGYEARELMDLTVQAITHPADVDKDIELAEKLARGELSRYQLEKRYLRKDGVVVDVLLGASIVRGHNHAPLYYVAQIIDVSDRKRAEETLRGSQEALRRAQRVAHLGSWERDLRTGFVARSPEVYAIYGIEHADAFNQPNALLQLVHSDDRERLVQTVEDSAREGRAFELEHRIVRPTGEERVVRLRGECDFDGDTPIRMTGTILDITEIRHAERELRESLQWLRQVLQQSPVGTILVHGARREHVEVNERALQMIGHGVEVNGGYVDFLDPVTQESIPAERLPSARALRGESFTWSEYGLRNQQGRIVPVVAGATPVTGDDNRTLGAVVIFQDITPVKDLERLRAEWNSIIAHDLRQPLGTISLTAQLLARRAADGGQRRSAEQIAAAARRLDRMINDLLDLSRLDAKQLTLALELVDLVELVRASVERARIGRMDRAFEVRVPEEPTRVSADPDRIAQVLDNLLSNAMKYGLPETPVIVEVQPSEGEVTVAVTNLGPGIEPDELPQLFRRFHRTDEARRSGVKGIGLGLYITRQLVEAHGGHISAESTPARSTTFRFTLPRAP